MVICDNKRNTSSSFNCTSQLDFSAFTETLYNCVYNSLVVCTCWLNSTHVIVDINASSSSFLNNITYYSHFYTRCSLRITISQKLNKGHEICPVVWLDCVSLTLFCHRLSVIEHNSYITIHKKKRTQRKVHTIGILSRDPRSFSELLFPWISFYFPVNPEI